MVHLLIAFKRKDGLSRAEFSRHWREIHAPLAKQMPGLRRYIQNHSPTILSRSLAYDGVVEIWMDTEEAITAAFNSKEYRASAYADEPNFANVKDVVRLVTEDHVLRAGEESSSPEPRIKRLSFIKRKPEWDRDEFFRYWKDVHGPMALAMPGLQRYVQCHALPSAYEKGEPQYDGVAELWFDTLGDLNFALASEEYKEGARPDGLKFVDPDSMLTLITEEYRIVY